MKNMRDGIEYLGYLVYCCGVEDSCSNRMYITHYKDLFKVKSLLKKSGWLYENYGWCCPQCKLKLKIKVR